MELSKLNRLVNKRMDEPQRPQKVIAQTDAKIPGYEMAKHLADVDEGKWDAAKKAAKKTYPGLSEGNDKFWKIVNTIYENMGGK
jgi:hypothetical protein